MNLTEAINLAKQGRSIGWGTIIISTYKEKKFITSRYLDSNVNKILHDSYVKALSSINLLHNPEIFSSWLGIIIASIAAANLVTNNEADFNQIGQYANENWYEKISLDPVSDIELTPEEIKKLAAKILKTLSKEETICVLHYYYEGFTVKEISRALRCSEEAVISFLNSAIKKSKAKLKKLKTINEKLSVFSNPIQFFIYLLHEQYNNLPDKDIPDKILNSIIDDTADIAAKKLIDEENAIAEEEDEEEKKEDEEEKKAGPSKKKAIISIIIIAAIIAAIAVLFGNRHSKPENTTDKPSESDTVSDTKPTDSIEITEENPSENVSDTNPEEEPNEPVANQRPNVTQQQSNQNQQSQNNNSNNNNNYNYNYNNNNSNNSGNSNSGGSQTNKPQTPAQNTKPTTQPSTAAPTNPPTTEAPAPPPSIQEPDFEIPDIE